MAEDKHDKHEHEQPHVPAPGKGAKIPAAAVAAAYAPRAAGEDDASAEANARVAADVAAQTSPSIPASQLVTQPTSDPLVSGRAMWIIVGPYKGGVLTMPDAEAENAKDDHWAINMSDMNKPFDANEPLDHDHELTDEDRAHAVEAANAWAEAQWNPEEPEEPPVEGETEDARRERDMRNEGRRARAKHRDEQKAQRDKQKPKPGQQPHPGQHPAQHPAEHANHKGKAAEPKPAGQYETR